MSRVVAFNAARATLRSQRWASLPGSRAVGPALLRLYASKSLPQHTIIDMPALSPTMTQGGVGAWNKKPGDKLEPGDVLVEIETDKAQMDFEFQDEGYLAKILLDTGAKDVPVGKPIGVFVESKGDVSAFKDFSLEDALAETGGSSSSSSSEAPKQQQQEEKKESKEPSKSEDKKSSAPPSSKSSAGSSGASQERIFASPLARKIASEEGVPLKSIKGTGPEGRIIKVDVEKYLSSKPTTSTTAATAGAPPPSSAATGATGEAYTDIPITTMRKVIAERLQESKRNSPHYIVTTTMDVSKLLKLRESLNSTADGRYKISVNDLLMKAVAKALLEVPQANSAWLGDQGVIRQYANVDLSVAVATPTGLITPIVRNINQLGLATISNTIKELGKRARAGKLQPQEYQGGTFTISNLGMNHAVTNFTAVINPPQSGILAVGTTERRAIEDPTSESGVSFTSVITCSASFDHRVVDGAVGGEFIKALKQSVENPLELLL